MSAAMSKVQKRLASLQRSRFNERHRRKFNRIRNAAVSAGTAYVIGSIEERSGALPTIAGIDPKLAWGGILTAAGYLVKGTAGEIVLSAAEGTLNAYAYQEGRGESFQPEP